MANGDDEWLFDSVIGFLKGPEWALPVMAFIDDNCIVFDSEDENKLAYMDIYAAFREMVESLMEMHLQDMGCTTAQFAELCAQRGSTDVGREVLEQILAVDDFVSFKKMMVKRNMELELESLKALQALSERIASGMSEPTDTVEDEFERQLQEALELSLKEAEEQGINTNVDGAEIRRQMEEAEEADLRMALALSLQLEDERAKLEAIAAEPPSPKAPAAPPVEPPAEPEPTPTPADPTPAPAAPAPAALAAPAAPLLGSAPSGVSAKGLLAPLQARGLPTMASGQDLRAAQVAANEAAARAAMARERAEKEREAAKQAAISQEMSVARAAEVRARAEHLKKQRDLLVAKRKKEREEQFKADPAQVGRAPDAPLPPQSELKKAAGYSDIDQDHRAMLSRTLAANMKASLLGEDVATLELQQRIEQHQRKAEFENTKAQLLAEVEASKARGGF